MTTAAGGRGLLREHVRAGRAAGGAIDKPGTSCSSVRMRPSCFVVGLTLTSLRTQVVEDICDELITRMGADLTPTKARTPRVAVTFKKVPELGGIAQNVRRYMCALAAESYLLP